MPNNEQIAKIIQDRYNDEVYEGGELEMVHAAVLDALGMYQAGEPLPKSKKPEATYVVFIGPFEQWDEFEQAEKRLEELAEENRYATLISAMLQPDDTILGLTVQPPSIHVAEAGEL